jgi:Cu-processing system permease protein
MVKILKYSLYDLSRSRWTYGYFLFYFIITFGLLYFSNDLSKAIISLMNIILVLNPLIATLFGALYYYNSREFVELLLALPMKRSSIFLGKYLGLSLSLSLSYLLGTGIPFIIYGIQATGQAGNFLLLMITGQMLTFIFTGISFLTTLRFENTIKGFGVSIFIWLFLAIIYDGLFLLFLLLFEQYPLDKFALIMTLFNPIDLSRVLIMLKLDISALMGYTGAVFNKFLGTGTGMVVTLSFLFVWIIIPLLVFLKLVRKKDF